MSGTSDWTDIPNNNIDQDSPATETLLTAIRDNINAAQWNYYDDSTGVIYDFAVDGAVSVITTPDFEDGYDYAFIGFVLPNGFFQLTPEAEWDIDGYSSIIGNLGSVQNRPEPQLFSGNITPYMMAPRAGFPSSNGGTRTYGTLISVSTSANDVVNKIRWTFSSPTTAGKIIMLRRHNNL